MARPISMLRGCTLTDLGAERVRVVLAKARESDVVEKGLGGIEREEDLRYVLRLLGEEPGDDEVRALRISLIVHELNR